MVSGAKGIARVAGGAVDAATGNLTDLDRKGGKPRGLARVATGAIDKLTGDRTDFDKRGATPLNKGQRDALNNKKPEPQEQPAGQNKQPVSKPQQPVKSPMDQENPGRAKAQQLAKDRISSGQTIAQQNTSNKQSMQDRARARNEKFKAERQKRRESGNLGRKNRPVPSPMDMRNEGFSDWRQELDEKCWPGYEKKGMKTMFGKRYPNCVKKSKKKK